MSKVKIGITVDAELLKWIDSQIKKKRFANRSHSFEYGIAQLKEQS